jgi:hypothetical protein
MKKTFTSFLISAVIAAPLVYAVATSLFLYFECNPATHQWWQVWVPPPQNRRFSWIATMLSCYLATLGLPASYFFIITPIRCKQRSAQRLVAEKNTWLPVCENHINEFLNSIYTVKLDIAVSRIPETPLLLFVMIDGYVYDRIYCNISGTDQNENDAKLLADHLINDYRSHKQRSTLFSALKQHADFITSESQFRRSDTVHKVDNKKQ